MSLALSAGSTIFADLVYSTSYLTGGYDTSSGTSVVSWTPSAGSNNTYWYMTVNPSNGNVYEVNGVNGPAESVLEITPSGSAVTSWNSYGTTILTGSGGIASAPNGNIYLFGVSGVYEFTASGVTVASFDSGLNSGTGAGSIAISPVSPYNLYVLTSYGSYPYEGGSISELSPSGAPVTSWYGAGTGFGNFNNPQALAVGPNGNVFVTDYSNNLVQEFDQNGNFLSQWTVSGPEGIAVAANGDVYVSSEGNRSIMVFGP